ncbi:MAG TPA: pyrrolo-quinoline quinone [Polyangia bacterium]|nr:pyrrolo-quinoline quinone [Polyangia bacterium]
MSRGRRRFLILAVVVPAACAAPSGADPSIGAAPILAAVTAGALSTAPDVLMQRYDFSRTGQNNTETSLTPANVRSATFGKLRTLPVDGYVYAQPLIKHGVTIGGAARDVVFVATEHDSLYAFDVNSGVTLWTVSYIGAPGVTTQPYEDTGDPPVAPGETPPDIYPEVGITSTPTIGPDGTMYVLAKTEENGTPVFRLHAVDITTGADRMPNAIVAPAAPGTGDDSSGGQITLDPGEHQQRPGLVLLNGLVYIAFGSSGDNFTWHGWVAAYRTSNLSLAAVWNTTPSGSAGGIWASGTAPAVDGNGNLYVPTGNGTFDGDTDFGSSVVKLATTSGIQVADYFAPFNQAQLTRADDDVGSGGVALLPDAAGTVVHPHLLVASGKSGTIYLLDRDRLGGFSSSTSPADGQVVQEIFNALGGKAVDNFSDPMENAADSFSTPAFWRDAAGRNHLYWGGVHDQLKMFNLANGHIATTPASTSPTTYGFPGASPSISSNGTANGILWAVDNGGGAEVLRAYDATNLAVELYNSDQAANGRDSLGPSVKFAMPVVTGGKVFVATRSTVAIFGLTTAPPVPAVPARALWLFGVVLAAFGLRALTRRDPR